MAPMPRTLPFDLSTPIRAGLALTFELVACMAAWSLFGVQRLIAWEAPLIGWRFVAIRVLPILAFPLIAGGMVKLYSHE
jgi:hypothetical protein